MPLAEALRFPDRLVRIRAGLTLGHGRPMREFPNYQNLMPVLCEALSLHGGARNALVVDADTESANTIARGPAGGRFRGRDRQLVAGGSAEDSRADPGRRRNLPCVGQHGAVADRRAGGACAASSAFRRCRLLSSRSRRIS